MANSRNTRNGKRRPRHHSRPPHGTPGDEGPPENGDGEREGWTPEMVRDIALDPRAVGVGGFPPVVAASAWINAQTRLIADLGPQEYAMALLNVLAEAFEGHAEAMMLRDMMDEDEEDETDPRRMQVEEIAYRLNVPYGGKLTEAIFQEAGYSDEEITELFQQNAETYHVQHADDASPLPVPIIIEALKAALDDRYRHGADHLANIESVWGENFDWWRELDRLVFNAWIHKQISAELHDIGEQPNSLSREDLAGIDARHDSENPIFAFTGSLDDAIKLFPSDPPERISREPITVCIEALSGWGDDRATEPVTDLTERPAENKPENQQEDDRKGD